MTQTPNAPPIVLERPLRPDKRIAEDQRIAAEKLSATEVRYLVDYYYAIQEDRKGGANQFRALTEAGEPGLVIDYLQEIHKLTEAAIKKALDAYTANQPLGVWAREITGIGPVIAAGLMANIDITQAPTVGHIWAFAGLNPEMEWKKGEKRPWNARLKTLCWKIGESFVKTKGLPDSFYGPLYDERRAYEDGRNERGELAEQAAVKLARFKIGKDTEASKWYGQGKLPPAHLHARAKRWTVKLFLAHYHHVAYSLHYKQDPPKPYILTQPGHVHEIRPPNWP